MRKRIETAILILAVVAGLSCESRDGSTDTAEPADQQEQAKPAKPIYGFELDDIDGNPVKLAKYGGKALLIVNVA
ncbi:MAG: hypothetical protein ACYTGS_16205, partial [Planctomycetota bacterium]